MGGFLRLTILLLFITDLSAQIITFNKTIPHDYLQLVYSTVKETKQGHYVLGIVGKDDITNTTINMILKVDNQGNLLWKRNVSTIDGLSNFSKLQVVTDNNENIYCGIIDSSRISINKYDLNGNLIWKKLSENTIHGWNCDLVFQDNELIAAAPGNTVKLTTDGNIIWEKSYPFDRGALNVILELVHDGSFAVLFRHGLKSSFCKFSSLGDTLWIKTFPSSTVSTFLCSASGFLLASMNYLKLWDFDGNEIWEKPLPGKYLSSCHALDGNYFFAGDKISKVNADGDTLWTKTPLHPVSDLTQTADSGLISVNGFTISKYNKEGLCRYINCETYSTIAAGLPFNLYWYSGNVESVNIDFSTDAGHSWIPIAREVPDTAWYGYSWKVPEIILENALIRISDSRNPHVFGETRFNIAYTLTQDYIAVNQIKMWMDNAGTGSHDFIRDGSGLYWPGGLNAEVAAIFTDGLVWGGYVNGQLKVNGSTYRTGLRPGKILENGKAGDPKNLEYNLWRLKKDWQLLPEGVERNRYEYNYNNWPGENGAPYDDVNGDGKFSRETDIPKLYGDETFWFVANDMDTAASKFLYGSNPMGMEMQCTVYGYNRIDELADVIFKKYKLINKSGQKIDSMCIGYWSDPDLGDANDDYVGCDTALGLGFVYNSDNNDLGYYGINPPAAGYLLLDSPPMTGFIFYIGPSATWCDPTLGRYEGSAQLYNYLNSKLWDGKDVLDPFTNQVSRFWLPGDPVAGVGWYQGEGWPGGEEGNDMRLMLRTGPYDVSAGDSVEITVAIILARGSDNINSVKVLKDKAKAVHNFYYHGILNEMETEMPPMLNYSLEQNYPNPFNPSTTIKYSLAEKAIVEISVYDILGKKVTTLVNEEKPAGEYVIQFNAHNLASGVYYYRMKTNEYLSTRKMLLIK